MHSLLPILLLCWSLCLAATTNADVLTFDIFADCPANMNYTRGSAFQANLNAILSSLPAAAAASSGFAENVTGGAPDQAYGLAQCRGDVSASDCRACLDDTAREMASMCPGQKRATLIYEGCQLWYSNASFFGSSESDTSDPIFKLSDEQNNARQPEQFMSRLSGLMYSLKQRAAFGSPRMFAAGVFNHTPFMTVYGTAQCRRDITADDCEQCLAIAVNTLPKCCEGKEGGRVFDRTCSVRFEVYPFYDAQGAEAAMSPAPAPGGGPVVNHDSNLSGDVLLPLPGCMR